MSTPEFQPQLSILPETKVKGDVTDPEFRRARASVAAKAGAARRNDPERYVEKLEELGPMPDAVFDRLIDLVAKEQARRSADFLRRGLRS